jgi:hypothetical protein
MRIKLASVLHRGGRDKVGLDKAAANQNPAYKLIANQNPAYKLY